MRLYKAYYCDVTCKDDVMIFFARDEFEAVHHIRERDAETTKQYVLDEIEEDIKEFIDQFGEQKKEALRLLKNRNLNGLTKLYWNTFYLSLWTIEEIHMPNKEHELFVCYPKDIFCEGDVEVIFVPLDTFRVEDYIYSVLAERLAESIYYKNNVEEYAINAGLNETFYKIDGKYPFNDCGNFQIADFVMDRCNHDIEKAWDLINTSFLDNVSEFFKDEPGYANTYLEHINNPENDIEFDEAFYTYCAKKEILNGSYITYEIEVVKP